MSETKKTTSTRKRGQRGKDIAPRKKRYDMSKVNAVPEDERKIIMQHNMNLFSLPKINPNDPAALSERIRLYFNSCAETNLSPSVAGFSLSLGIDRRTLWTWMAGTVETVKNQESLVLLKNAYNFITAQYEDLMNNSKINPVAGIFLMKNNMGYKDQTDHVIEARQEQTATEDDLTARADLLGEGSVD